MDIHNTKTIKNAAREALGFLPDNKKTVMIWAGVNLALSLLLSLLNLLLDGRMADTGGLSGISLRSTLATAQSALMLGGAVLVPFWNLGYISAVLGFARRQPAGRDTLYNGFRRFGPAFRMMLLRILVLLSVGLVCFFIGSMVMELTPLAKPVYAFIDAHQAALLSNNLDPALAEELLRTMLPILIGSFLITLGLLLPIIYLLRLTDYLVMDEPSMGAIACLISSFRLMRRNRLALLRLDLSFWWFYLISFLATVLCYGDGLLVAFGVPLPMRADIAFIVFYLAALLVQFALLYFCGNRVYTAYAVFYDTLRNPADGDPQIPGGYV